MNEPSSVMMADPGSSEPETLLSRALAGDERAFAALFDAQREKLRRLVRLRLDRRLSGRVDTDDVLQEAYLEARRRLADYARSPQGLPFHLWLRLVTGQKLTDLHRHHLGAQARDAGMEVSLHRGAFPQASSGWRWQYSSRVGRSPRRWRSRNSSARASTGFRSLPFREVLTGRRASRLAGPSGVASSPPLVHAGDR